MSHAHETAARQHQRWRAVRRPDRLRRRYERSGSSATDQETAPQEEEESRADGRVQRELTDADQRQSVAGDVEATSSGRRDHHHCDVDDAGGVHVAVRAAARQHRLLADVHGSLPLLSRPSPPCPAAARWSGSRRADPVGQLATVPDVRRRRRRHSVIVVERCCPSTGHWLNSDVVTDCCHGSTSSTSAAARSSRCSQVSASVAVLITVFVCSPP